MITAAMPSDALKVLTRLWHNGHAAYAVGGGVRDAMLGRPLHDIDLTTDARPDRILELFPTGHQRGVFGTIDVDGVEVTTFRRDHTYRDHRRPDEVTWTDDVDDDLRRRDFTINAIAWGRPAESTMSGEPALHDPMGGAADLQARLLRAVGDPDARFEEDALRLLRGARFAATLGFDIEAQTLGAMRAHGRDAQWLSAERVHAELRRMLTEARPSDGLGILDAIGVLAVVLPELTAQHGVAQAKIPGRDLFDHSLATADAAAAMPETSERLILAALLHDIGKPATASDGHFIGHAEVGARMAASVLHRLRWSAVMAAAIGHLISEHMFQYRPGWTDAAVRRFLRRVGPGLMDDLLRLRQADNVGSGQDPDTDHLPELRSRLAAQRLANVPLTLAALCVTGDDLVAAVGRAPGPWVGEMLDRLLESVVNDPRRNRPDVLVTDVRRWQADARVAD